MSQHWYYMKIYAVKLLHHEWFKMYKCVARDYYLAHSLRWWMDEQRERQMEADMMTIPFWQSVAKGLGREQGG